jgi:hypothetical protein
LFHLERARAGSLEEFVAVADYQLMGTPRLVFARDRDVGEGMAIPSTKEDSL